MRPVGPFCDDDDSNLYLSDGCAIAVFNFEKGTKARGEEEDDEDYRGGRGEGGGADKC